MKLEDVVTLLRAGGPGSGRHPGNAWDKTIENFRQAKASKDPYWEAGEMVPIEELKPYREYDRKANEKYPGHFDSVRDYIQKNGIDDMGILMYNPKTQKVYMGEGNTRLAVAKDLGFTHIPMRVYRSQHENSAGKEPPSRWSKEGHIPADIKPSEIGFTSKHAFID